MHELSIAGALLDLARAHLPAGARLRAVVIEAGPLQAIDPVAMAWAWASLCRGTPDADGAVVRVNRLPWRLKCGRCGTAYAADELDAPCPACGRAGAGVPVGGNELLLSSLDCEPPPNPEHRPVLANAGATPCRLP